MEVIDNYVKCVYYGDVKYYEGGDNVESIVSKLTEEDFERAYLIADLCEKCGQESEDFQMIAIKDTKFYRCPNCGRIS